MSIKEYKLYEERLKEVIKFLKPIDAGYNLIRLGCKDRDGGYLLPDDLDDLDGIGACFSPGVAMVVDFERDMVERGINCYLTDGTIEQLPVIDESMHFIRKNLGREDNGLVQELFGKHLPQMRLDTWININSNAGDLILQMDIEGAEYDVFDSVQDDTLTKFRIIVVEFHDFGELLSYYPYKSGDIIHRVFQRLSHYFSAVHIHPNNANPLHLWGKYEVPNLLEVTFLRKDRINYSKPIASLPHRLDCHNVKGYPKVELPSYWYR